MFIYYFYYIIQHNNKILVIGNRGFDCSTSLTKRLYNKYGISNVYYYNINRHYEDITKNYLDFETGNYEKDEEIDQLNLSLPMNLRY